ncbi:hypothetical protein BC938DRAFT_477650 [Jimgerdemannia flammicorona]|uniref:Uncharacterized protein n=1 Tax=Jimgerdemannia flammicorona TaxID=994334 RepID=A0A433P8H4_9FUNG|nr:hypothetical protein BC938DRAFT_477650 [Jimgerdemannia flammicorona]
MLLELKSFNIEILSLEVGNTEMGYDDTKERVDRSALTIQLKDMLDQFRYGLHFKKKDLENIFTIGIQASGKASAILSEHCRITNVYLAISNDRKSVDSILHEI